jgi:hypothetical protein
VRCRLFIFQHCHSPFVPTPLFRDSEHTSPPTLTSGSESGFTFHPHPPNHPPISLSRSSSPPPSAAVATVEGGTAEVALEVDPQANPDSAAATSSTLSKRKSMSRKRSIAGASEAAVGSVKAADAEAAGKDADAGSEAGDGSVAGSEAGAAAAAAVPSSNRVRRQAGGPMSRKLAISGNKAEGDARAVAAGPEEDPVEERLADEAATAAAAERQARLHNRRRQRRRGAQVRRGAVRTT